ncbi:Abi-alpha family protein [Vibrio parahaemolyticus]|nr:Abi-alpha family protein [Vibrio parahaemolyticus]
MDEITEVVKSAPKVIEEVYSDGVSSTLKEASKIGVDAVKTIRLMLFPLQFGAMAQDRLAKYIAQSLDAVPVENRIEPTESLAFPLAEKLRVQEEGSLLTEAYLNLLSRAMDRERVGEAHPAFINIISQLCPDEILLLNQIGKSEYLLLFMLDGEIGAYSKSAIVDYVDTLQVNENTKNHLKKYAFERESIAQPELLTTLLEHIVSMGLVIYDVNLFERKGFWGLREAVSYPEHYVQRVQLTKFGELFFKACVSGEKFA